MQRQRIELVPIGDASPAWTAGEGAREVSPQARHHFNQADQVNQLVLASEADPDLGFMARMMVLCSLPRTNPGNRKEYKRVNGPYTLAMTAGVNNKLPFGSLPVCCWPGSRPKRYGSKAVRSFWGARSPSSCERGYDSNGAKSNAKVCWT